MRTDYPLQDLFWECTLRCNAYCAFCGSRCGDTESEELTTEEILSAFRDVAQKLDPRQIMINVTGGEPLLRKDLCHVMSQCTELGFSWGMVTNGLLLTGETVERLRAAGMKTVSVSLDGLEQTHNALRGVKDGFRRTLEGIRRLKAGNFLEQIMVTTVVTRKNIGELEQLHGLLQELGIDCWRVAMVDPIGRAREQQSLLLDQPLLEEYLAFLTSHSGDTQPRVITSCSHYLGGADLAFGRERFRCRTGKQVASILANGDIFVCPNVQRRPELIQGNVKRDSLPEVWERGFAWFREPENRRGEDCRHCPDWQQCRGDSVHTWNFEEGSSNFCYRRFFPREEGEVLNGILQKLKPGSTALRGIRVRYHPDSTERVVFTPNAARELYSLFHWGQFHPVNASEQLACLLGHRLADCLLVEFVSPAYLEQRNSLEAVFTETSYRSGQSEAEAINLHYGDCPELCLVPEDCVLLGFAHSHPGELELGMSEPDVQLHRYLNAAGHPLSMIVNPQKRQLAAYCARDMELAEVVLLVEEREIAQWNFPELAGE